MTDKPHAPSTYDFEPVVSAYDQAAGHQAYRGTHVEVGDYDELAEAFDAVETERDEALARVEELEEQVSDLKSDLTDANMRGD